MKVEITQSEIDRYLPVIERVISKNVTFPILNTVRVEATAKQLVLRATNLELGVEITLPAKVGEEGVVVVSGATFFQILRFGKGSTSITIETKGSVCHVTTGSGEATIKTHPSEEFPTIPHLKEDGVVVKTKVLADCLRSVAYTASTSLIKPELASVYLYEEGNSIVCVATDSFRLAERVVPLKQKTNITPILIPSRNVPEILRALEYTEEEDVLLVTTEHQFSLSFGRVYVTSRLTQGSFPDYRQIIPKKSVTEVTLLREDFAGALKHVGVFLDKFSQVRFALYPKKKKYIISAKNDEVGEITETVAAEISGEDLEISFNAKYLSDSLQSISTDSVTLAFAGQGKPLVIRGVGNQQFLYLVMPMNR